MRKVDYIIVGQGFAGTFFAHQLIREKKSFVLFDAEYQTASKAAAGVYNPVVLKRFNVIWGAQSQITYFVKVMKDLEVLLGQSFLNPSEVRRIFHNQEECEIWKSKAQTESLKPFLDTEIMSVPAPLIGDFGSAKVHQSGRIDARRFLNTFRKYLMQNDYLQNENFDYESLKMGGKVQYKAYWANHIVFAEGKGIQNNPYFNHLPIRLNKGECLEIQLENPLPDAIYKKKDFLFALGERSYYLGGTYAPKDPTEDITNHARNELLHNLKEMYPNIPKVLNQQFGFRPVTPDRRPLVGTHPDFKNVFLLNGLGSRGTLLGAYFAKELYEYIEKGIPLSPEVELHRFSNR